MQAVAVPILQASKLAPGRLVETLNFHVSTAPCRTRATVAGCCMTESHVAEVYDEHFGTPFNFIYDAGPSSLDAEKPRTSL